MRSPKIVEWFKQLHSHFIHVGGTSANHNHAALPPLIASSSERVFYRLRGRLLPVVYLRHQLQRPNIQTIRARTRR
jgi:hypothetical protein